MPTSASVLHSIRPLCANMGALPLILADRILWVLSVPVIALIEGAIIAWFYKWQFARTLWTAFWINVLTTVLGVIAYFIGYGVAGAQLTGLSLAQASRRWLLLALELWLSFYVATLMLEAALLHVSAQRRYGSGRFVRALKTSAVMNLVTYALLGWFWLPGQAPRMGGATLVDRAEWLPAIDETFLYEHPSGTSHLGTTQGRDLGPLGADVSTVLPKASLDRFAELRKQPRRWHSRDGTRASALPSSTFIGKLTVAPRAGAAADGSVPADREATFSVWGTPGLLRPLLFASPNVLPGGRYVLFECSGEIMVLDIEARKLVSLFRGSNPVALSSFEPEEALIPAHGAD